MATKALTRAELQEIVDDQRDVIERLREKLNGALGVLEGDEDDDDFDDEDEDDEDDED